MSDNTLATIWLLATVGNGSYKKASKGQLLKLSIPNICNNISDTVTNLRFSSNLLLGVSRLYKQKTVYVYNEVNNIRVTLSRSKKSAARNIFNAQDFKKFVANGFLQEDCGFDISLGLVPPLSNFHEPENIPEAQEMVNSMANYTNEVMEFPVDEYALDEAAEIELADFRFPDISYDFQDLMTINLDDVDFRYDLPVRKKRKTGGFKKPKSQLFRIQYDENIELQELQNSPSVSIAISVGPNLQSILRKIKSARPLFLKNQHVPDIELEVARTKRSRSNSIHSSFGVPSLLGTPEQARRNSTPDFSHNDLELDFGDWDQPAIVPRTKWEKSNIAIEPLHERSIETSNTNKSYKPFQELNAQTQRFFTLLQSKAQVVKTYNKRYQARKAYFGLNLGLVKFQSMIENQPKPVVAEMFLAILELATCGAIEIQDGITIYLNF